jgi:hypothetical protein
LEYYSFVVNAVKNKNKIKIMADRIFQYDVHEGIEMGWHGKTHVVPEITLDNNWLTRWEIVPQLLEKKGKPTKWAILECSDIPDLEIGQPYNPETFKPVDNKAFLELVRASIAGTEHEIVSVGSVRNRGRVFLSLKLNGMETFEAGGRKFSSFLNFGNGHDRSSVLWANTSNTCTVCDNTFSINLFSVENAASNPSQVSDNSDDIQLRQRHTKNVTMRLPAMATLIDKAVGVQGEFQVAFEALSKIPFTSIQATKLFTGFIGRKSTGEKLSSRSTNTVNRLVGLFENGKGNTGQSRADAFSAATDYFTHYSSGNGSNPMRQFLSSEYGVGQQSKTELWNILADEDETNYGNLIRNGERLLAGVST